MILCDGPTPVGDAMRRCEELRDGKPRRPRARSGDHALSVRAPRDGGALRRGARVRAQEQPGARRGEHAQRFVAIAELLLVREGARRRPCRRRAGPGGEVALFRDTRGGAPDRLGWRPPTGSPTSIATTAAGTTPRSASLSTGGRSRWGEAGPLGGAPRLSRRRGSRRTAASSAKPRHSPSVPSRSPSAPRRAELARHTWPALAEVQRAGGNNAEADAAVATALELYEQKGNVAAATACRRRQRRSRYLYCAKATRIWSLANICTPVTFVLTPRS